MILITSNLVKTCFIDHIKWIEQEEKHYTVNIDIYFRVVNNNGIKLS